MKMPTKKYDEIVKQPCDKLAQTMSDLTYLYKETKVPKAHYKKIMEETIEEQMTDIITMKMLDVYLKTLKQIIDDSPVLFLKSLICLEMKINPTNMRPQEQIALEMATSFYMENKKSLKSILNEQITSVYKDTLENGILNTVQENKMKAVCAGYEFALFHEWELEGIQLKETGVKVQVEGIEYNLLCGSTFEDSRKIDNMLDRVGGKSTKEFQC